MSRRLLFFLILLLLAGAALAYYTTAKNTPIKPQQETPAESPKQPVELPAQPEPPAAVSDEAEAEPQTHTLRTTLQKQKMLLTPAPPDTTIRLKKEKARELVPGVTIENKELQIQLDQVNERLHIRRDEEQVEVLWKQKF